MSNMGLEEVKQEIINKAKKDAEKIIKSAEQESKDIVNSAKDEIDAYKKVVDTENKSKISAMERIYSSSANASARHIILQKKKEIIDNVFKSARNKIFAEMETKDYLHQLLKKAEKEIAIGTVYCDKSIAKNIEGYNATEKDIIGIIAESKDGSVIIDLEIDTILEDIRGKTLQDIAGMLFR